MKRHKAPARAAGDTALAAMVRQLEEAEARLNVLVVEIDRLESAHRADRPGFMVRVGEYDVSIPEDIRRVAAQQGISPEPYLAVLRDKQRALVAWQKRIGTYALEREQDRLAALMERTRRAIARTPAAGRMGLHVKAGLILTDLRHGEMNDTQDLLRSLVRDLAPSRRAKPEGRKAAAHA